MSINIADVKHLHKDFWTLLVQDSSVFLLVRTAQLITTLIFTHIDGSSRNQGLLILASHVA